MINKIVCGSFLFFALIALFLSLAGVREADLSQPFMSFLVNTSREMDNWKIAIPDIPHIPIIQESNNSFFGAVNNIIVFLNGLVDLLNFVVMAVNTIIQLLEFIFFILKNLITMKEDVLNSSGTILVS